MTAVSVLCPAKLNLRLRILAREESGYHQIETVFQAVGLFDRVEARPGPPGTALQVARREAAPGLGDVAGDIGPPERNTVARAAAAFFGAARIRPAVSLLLTKTIPAGTGLGGASSDAAGTLAALNLLHGEPLGAADLMALGGRIGADAPFFCARAPAALGWGRGDRLLPLAPPPPAHAVLVVPRERVATAAAYVGVAARLRLPPPAALLEDAAPSGADPRSWSALARLRRNDFEIPAFAARPALREICDELAASGALVAGMTGSGSALYGVFEREEEARNAARRVGGRADGAVALVAPTLTEWPAPRMRGADGAPEP